MSTKQTLIVGICGKSGSGKTSYSNMLKSEIKNITVITTDNYYYGGNDFTNFDHIAAINWNEFIRDVKLLRDGKSIEMPTYSFQTHSRTKITTTVKSSKIIIIEGILIFAISKLVELFDLKIFIDADSDVAYRRRLNRDIRTRGRTKKEVDFRWDRDVKAGYVQFVKPNRNIAHIIINNNEDMLLAYPKQIIQFEIIRSYIEMKVAEFK